MKKIFALALVGISFIALADKNNKPASEPKTKAVQKDTAYRFGFVGDTSSTQIDFGTREYDNRLGRYYHIDPVQNSPYDSLQNK